MVLVFHALAFGFEEEAGIIGRPLTIAGATNSRHVPFFASMGEGVIAALPFLISPLRGRRPPRLSVASLSGPGRINGPTRKPLAKAPGHFQTTTLFPACRFLRLA